MKSISVSNLRWKGRCTFVLTACLVLASCQTTHMPGFTKARPLDLGDPCHPVRSQLTAAQDHFKDSIATGAAVGTVIGIFTSVITGDTDEALKRAIIGGLTGAAAGYVQAKLTQAKTREELRQAINADVQGDTRQVTEMGTKLRNLNACRRGQVADVKRNFDDGIITAEQTQAALQAVRASVESDNTLIEEILGEVTKNKGVYVASISQVENKAEEEILVKAAAQTSETAVVPKPATNIQKLDRANREVRDEHEKASADLFRQIEEMEELTLV